MIAYFLLLLLQSYLYTFFGVLQDYDFICINTTLQVYFFVLYIVLPGLRLMGLHTSQEHSLSFMVTFYLNSMKLLRSLCIM